MEFHIIVININTTVKKIRFYSSTNLFSYGIFESLRPETDFPGKRIEHSENIIIRNFENEVEPGVLQSRLQQTSPQENFRRKGLCAFHIFTAGRFFERFTEHSRSDLVIKQPRLPNKLYFWNALFLLRL